MSKIEKLTPKQEALLPTYRDKFLEIGLRTGPIDRAIARAAVDQMYVDGGLTPPGMYVFLGSPLAGIVGANIYRGSQVSAQVRAQVGDQVYAQVRDQVGDQVRDQVRAQVSAQVRDQVRAQVSAQVRDQVRAQVSDQVYDQVGDQVRDQVGNQLTFIWPTSFGQHDAGWISFFSYFRDNTATDLRPFGGLEKSVNLGWSWLYKDIAFITERPSTLRRDDRNRLHSADGMAIQYTDGWGFWCWHGVRVPQHVIEAPETITVDQIKAERNAEIRRVMVTRYGQDRYIRDAGASVIAMDEVGILYGLPQEDDEEIRMVRVLNSTLEPDGSQKEYMLRVPPTIETPKEAVAWTFGVDAKDYAPVAQT
jgi:hypothetical protein